MSFPLPGVAGFAWLIPGLLLAVTADAPAGWTFRLGYLAATTHYLVSLSWLRFIPFPAGAYTGWFALSLFLALLPPLWILACRRAGQVLKVLPARWTTWTAFGDHLGAAPWWRLQLWCVLCGAAWVTWEMLLARLFGGFPWNLLGASQYRLLPVIQMASATGVYGVSFFVVWFSVSLGVAVTLLLHDPDRTARWRRPLVFPALMLGAITVGGVISLHSDTPPPRLLRVALIQPSIPQTVIFDPDAAPQRFETLLRLTEQALTTRPDLVLWPEASLPGGLSREDLDALLQRIRDAGVWMIFGSDETEDPPPGTDETSFRAYNAAFLVNPAGEVVAGYRKQRLVMFGEYIPFGRWLPFLRRLAPIGDGFHPGQGPVPFPLGSLKATASVLICFEDNFPQQAREHAGPDIDLLINLTNNAWFGESAAQWQHAANAVFRAIENGLPLIRCANNGLSGWIDPRGRLHSVRIAEGRNVYAAGFEIAAVRFGNGGRTLYHRVGDAFGWSCVLATLAGLRPRSLRLPRRPHLSPTPRSPVSADDPHPSSRQG